MVVDIEFTMCNIMLLLSRMIYNKCNCTEEVTTHEVRHHKHGCSVVTKTYETDQECVSVMNHSDKPNEFPRSTEWVFVLFTERGLEFLRKSLQQ